MVTTDSLIAKLQGAFPGARISAKDLTGGGDHWQVAIVAAEFAGKSMVDQHRLVYAALGTWMQRDIHALALQTSSDPVPAVP